MRILISGSRKWEDYDIIHQALLHATSGETEVTIVTGGAKGADHLAEQIARVHGWGVQVFKADWKLGKQAGPIRNEQMLKESGADLLLAFWDGASTGTKHMIDLCTQAGWYIRVYRPDGTHSVTHSCRLF